MADEPTPWFWTRVGSPEQIQLLTELSDRARSRGFYLAGGTALAAQLGHRISVDLDFFRKAPFSPEELLAELSGITEVQIERNTLNGTLRGIKVQFLGYPYPLLEPLRLTEWNLPVASITDIAVMKLSAVMSRGAKKDFIDLHRIAREPGLSLIEIIEQMPRKFPGLDDSSSRIHLFKSLVWFADAEEEPDPAVLEADWTWKTTKAFFEREIKGAMR